MARTTRSLPVPLGRVINRFAAVGPSALSSQRQEGGIAVDDITAPLPDEDWAELSKEFFLS